MKLIFLARTTVVECWSLSNIDQSPDASFALLDLGKNPCMYPLPGCLLVPTSTGIYILDLITLTPIPCKMLQTTTDSDEDDGIPRPQFDVSNCTLTILSVFDINWSSNENRQHSLSSITTTVKNQSDFTCVAMGINYRLIVMKITRR